MITDVNPFVYSHPVSAEEVIDRDDETDELLRNAVGGHFVRLYAPRKYGKTSLLKRALRDGEATEGLIPILVDLYRVSSIADVTLRLERAYSKQLKGAVRNKIEDFLQKTGIGVSLGAYGISAKLHLDPKVDPLPALHALLDLPLRLEESGGYRAFVALDEFQDEVASYIFAGSEPGLMKQLFEHKDRTLYGSAVPLRLQRLANEDIAAYIVERFRDSDRAVGDALNPLLDSAKGHPQRAMLLAHRLWAEVGKGETATLDHWRAAHAAALAELNPEFDAQWRGFDTSQQKTMRAVIAGAGSPYKADVRRRLELTKDMVRKAIPRLTATAEIELVDGKHVVVDPLFAEWIEGINQGSSEADAADGDAAA